MPDFSLIGYLMGREMVLRELGASKTDRANQLGVIGGVMPNPVMGAVMSMAVARNEASGQTTTVPPSASVVATTSVPGGALRRAFEIKADDKLIEADQPVDFGTQSANAPSTRKVVFKNISGSKLVIQFVSEGKGFRFDPTNSALPFELWNGLSFEIKVTYLSENVTPEGQKDEARIRVRTEYAEFEQKVVGQTIGPKLKAQFADADWSMSNSPLAVSFTAQGETKSIRVDNEGVVELRIQTPPATADLELLDSTGRRAEDTEFVIAKAEQKDGKFVPGSVTIVATATGLPGAKRRLAIGSNDPKNKFLIADLDLTGPGVAVGGAPAAVGGAPAAVGGAPAAGGAVVP